MSDNVVLPGTGVAVASDEVTDATLGTVQVQVVKIWDGAINSTNKLGIDSSGRITVVQGTSPWVMQGQQSTLSSGTITTTTSAVTVSGATNYNLATVGIFGTYNSVTFLFEGSPDGSNWFSLQGQRTDTGIAETGGTLLTNTIRAWDVFVGGWTQFRVRATAWTSGTANVLITLQTMPTEPVPTVVQGPPGTLANFWPVRHTDGTNSMPAADAAARGLYARITDGTNTLPTADTVGRALYARITDGTNSLPTADAAARALFSRITDGTNSNTVRAASTPSAVADTAQVVTQRPVSSGTPQVSTASTNAANIKGSAGVYYGVIAVNTTATLAYLKVFDKATAATLGTDTPILNIPIPANTSGAGVAVIIPMGRGCTSGIQANVVGGSANLDSSNAVAGVILNHLFL